MVLLSEAGPADQTAADTDGLRELFRRLAGGDAGALEPLYDSVADRLYGLALWRSGSPDEAAEVVQEVFVRLAERPDRLAAVADPLRWLLSVAHNAAVDRGRRRQVRAAAPLDEASFLAAPEEDPSRPLDAARASRLLAQLPAPQRDAIYLHLYAERTFAQIGDITGVPTFTAASRYRLGLARLRRLLGRRP